MHDNKLRLSPDIIAKAEEIAETWGLKNSRAAIEAVFRKYADDYLYGRQPMMAMMPPVIPSMVPIDSTLGPANAMTITPSITPVVEAGCDALNELDNLLGL
ncbi:MAG: hypothetical protein RLZZ511_3610 [Cyanobacteriota bacterium]|jgi:hypothetical protein